MKQNILKPHAHNVENLKLTFNALIYQSIKQFWDKNLTQAIDITSIIFVKDISFANSILESLLAFLKFIILYKHRSNSKSKNLIQYKGKNITNLKLKVNF